MSPAEWRRKLAKMLAVDKLAREQESKPPVPRMTASNVALPPNTEELLKLEQHELAGVVDDAIALLKSRPSEAAKAALWERAGKLSSSALLTAKILIKARLDTRNHKNS